MGEGARGGVARRHGKIKEGGVREGGDKRTKKDNMVHTRMRSDIR